MSSGHPTLPSLFSLQGQTALVTGATRGIGREMTLALAEAGANIIMIQRSAAPSETATRCAQEHGVTVNVYVCDLSSKQEVQNLVPQILKDGLRVDILLNCAGIQRRHPSHEFDSADWDEVLQVNLTSVFTLCRDVGAHMLSTPPPSPHSRRGSIINVASLLSFQGGITVPAYAASKGGVTQITKTFSNDWAGKGITVNAIAPGYVATEMNAALMADEGRAETILARIPAGRWGRPEDFRGPVVFLASAASGYVTGEVLVVDGGWMGR